MSFASSRSLFDQQLELIRIVVGLRQGMAEHLRRRVLPHLDPDARVGVENAIDFLDEHDDIGINLLCFVDIARAEMREAIAAGTSEKRVPIPRKRLIGTTEAYDVHRVLSPQAEALSSAMLPIEELAKATSQLAQFAEAVRLSADIAPHVRPAAPDKGRRLLMGRQAPRPGLDPPAGAPGISTSPSLLRRRRRAIPLTERREGGGKLEQAGVRGIAAMISAAGIKNCGAKCGANLPASWR